MTINESAKKARDIVTSYDGPKLRIMEVCGTHTHEIFRLGIRRLLPDNRTRMSSLRYASFVYR